MASLSQHCADTEKFLGHPFRDVHSWIDESFRSLGSQHRQARHHREGIHEAGKIFGAHARLAAAIHILRDCRHIPLAEDYQTGFVDALGFKSQWSTAAYILYNDEDFEDLVHEFLDPTALLLWSFLSWEDSTTFLASTTKLSGDEIASLRTSWQTASESLLATPQIEASQDSFVPLEKSEHANDEVGIYLAAVHKQLQATVPLDSQIGFIDISVLGNPFVYIDYELLEDLKPELLGKTPLDIARFAIPEKVMLPMSAVGDAYNQKAVTLISRQKTMTVSDVRLRQTDQGTEVSFLVSASATGVVAAATNGQYLLRNGIHRAFLLADNGIKRIPCVVVHDRNPLPVVSAAYTTFAPQVLVQPRRPMLADLLDSQLCTQIPIRRTNKLVRISAEALNIPVD